MSGLSSSVKMGLVAVGAAGLAFVAYKMLSQSSDGDETRECMRRAGMRDRRPPHALP